MPLSVNRSPDRFARWREGIDPFQRLTTRIAQYLTHKLSTGQMAATMWTLWNVEQSDEDLMALIAQRVGALVRMDWSIKTVAEDRKGFDETLAKEQAAALREQYERLTDLNALRRHLALTFCRKFAIAEIMRDSGGDVSGFAFVDPWNTAREGLRGDWKYNPKGDDVDGYSSGLQAFDPEETLIYEREFSILRPAIKKFVRYSIGQKDWDGNLEIFGIPGGVVTMPQDTPPDKAANYEAAAVEIARGGSGVLPHGSTYTANGNPTGEAPFKSYLDHCSEKLVLAGTGGKLTMLAAATGIGSGPSEEHAETFKTIAQADAQDIDAFLQRRIDEPFIARHFPDKPVLAYFCQAFAEETDVGAIVDQASKLSAAGMKVNRVWLAEKTGMVFDEPEPVEDDAPPTKPGSPGARARKEADAADLALANRQADLPNSAHPDQPRVPAGSEHGGEFAPKGGTDPATGDVHMDSKHGPMHFKPKEAAEHAELLERLKELHADPKTREEGSPQHNEELQKSFQRVHLEVNARERARGFVKGDPFTWEERHESLAEKHEKFSEKAEEYREQAEEHDDEAKTEKEDGNHKAAAKAEATAQSYKDKAASARRQVEVIEAKVAADVAAKGWHKYDEDIGEPKGKPLHHRAAADDDAEAPGLPAATAEADFASLLDVRRGWLGPALPFLHRLEAVAGDPRVSTEDFIAQAEAALLEIPELASALDTGALATALEARLGRAALDGVATALAA